MLGVLSAWLKVLNTRTKNNLIRRFPFSLSPVNIGAILNNPRALLYGFCCHVIYAPVFIGHFVINLDWPFSQPSLKDPANSPSWTQFSWNLDALPSFKFPLFFWRCTSTFLQLKEWFFVDFCTRRDVCKTTTIVYSSAQTVMNSIDFPLILHWHFCVKESFK